MAFNSVKNYYDILEVSADSSLLDIKSAYRRLARKFHPDVNKSQDAIEKFKMISLAYETLSDPIKKRDYDIVNGIFKSDSDEQKQQNQEESIKFQKKDNDDVKSNFGEKSEAHKKENKYYFSNLFKKFKLYRRYSNIKKSQKGENINVEVSITPEESLTGSQRIINVRTTSSCSHCFGHKFLNDVECPNCHGEGEIVSSKKITVNIPKGIKDGAKLRLKGEGSKGKNGGINGDLFIKIKINATTQIHYDKLNIYYNLPISPYEAALGGEILIPAFDGKIKLKIPPKTSSGQKFRVANQGIKKNGKVGDLIICVSIEFSHDLSDDEIKLYKELKKVSKDDVRKNFGVGS